MAMVLYMLDPNILPNLKAGWWIALIAITWWAFIGWCLEEMIK
jgi:hypothetical protein